MHSRNLVQQCATDQLSQVPRRQRLQPACTNKIQDPMPLASLVDILHSYIFSRIFLALRRNVSLNETAEQIGENLGFKSVDMSILCNGFPYF